MSRLRPRRRRSPGRPVGPTTTDPLQTTSFITGSRPFPPSAGNSVQNAWEIYGNDASPGARRLMAIAICIPKS